MVTVQNLYNLANRDDDAMVDRCAAEGIAYAAYFPLGGFTPLQSATLSDVAGRLGASAQQVALAWLLQRSPAMALIPGTSSVAHLRENIAAADLVLPPDAIADLDAIGRSAGQPQPRAASVNAPLTAATMAGMASSPSGWDGFSASTVTT